jgi:hypothetical protein
VLELHCGGRGFEPVHAVLELRLARIEALGEHVVRGGRRGRTPRVTRAQESFVIRNVPDASPAEVDKRLIKESESIIHRVQAAYIGSDIVEVQDVTQVDGDRIRQ